MDIEELIIRHQADAWECHARGRADLSQLHMVFVQELEAITHHWSNGLPVVRIRLPRLFTELLSSGDDIEA